jgi:GcrA cell cycle regulator
MVANWTEKRLKRLKLLNKEGFSATVIAGKLGPAFTKAIVLRKLHLLEEQRLDCAKKRAGSKASKARALSRASKQAKAPRKATPAPPAQASPAVPVKAEPIRVVSPARPTPAVLDGIRLFDLREGHCRWPLGDERPARLFCGAPSVGTTSWCEHHQRLAFSGTWRPAASPPFRAR